MVRQTSAPQSLEDRYSYSNREQDVSESDDTAPALICKVFMLLYRLAALPVVGRCPYRRYGITWGFGGRAQDTDLLLFKDCLQGNSCECRAHAEKANIRL